MGSCLIRSRISYGAKPIKKPFLIDREKVCNRILYAYKLSPKSALNFATNFSGQSDVADNFPKKNRNTLGSSTNVNPPINFLFSYKIGRASCRENVHVSAITQVTAYGRG